jgi:AcrR family transcriptional regulator
MGQEGVLAGTEEATPARTRQGAVAAPNDGTPARAREGAPAAPNDGALARTHEGEPGLPRGRSGLPPETVRAAQRERLLRAVIAAVARAGFNDVTVADIVRAAKVSRAAFYAHFGGKEDCFLAATSQGGQLMMNRVAAAARSVSAGAPAQDVLRASIAAFLRFLAEEPAFARVFYIDMATAGPRAVRHFEAAQHSFAKTNRAWHERARRDHPGWPAVPYEAYYALAGATTELVRAEVNHGRVATVTALEDMLMALHLAVLAAEPWPP